jgi:hypothetical protein
MLRILRSFYSFTGFLSLSHVCRLWVCLDNKYVFVYDRILMSNNQNLSEFTENGLFTSYVLAAYCGIGAHHFPRNPIQNT